MTINIKQHCKTFNEKFVCNHPIGFITSKKSDVMAGMKVNAVTGEITDYKIRKIGTKYIYFLNKVHSDGDVQLYGQFTNLEQAINVNN